MKHCPGCELDLTESQFGKNRCRKDGLQGYCRECTKLLNRTKYADKAMARAANWASDPSGTYIGSGAIRLRRNRHLSGSCRVGKGLNEKAVEFKILLKCDKENCLMYEQLLMDNGFGELNKQRACK